MDPSNFFESGAGASQLQWRTLLQAIEQNPVTILITDSEGRIEYSNPRLTELTG